MSTDTTGPARAGRADGGSAWGAAARVVAAAAVAVAWSLLVAASPARFFSRAAPWCLIWLAVSALAAPAGLRDRLRPRLTDVALGAAAAVVLYAGARAFLWTFCGGLTDALCPSLGAMFERFHTRAVLPGLTLFFLAAPAEELFWRGVVQARLAHRMPPALAVIVATALAAALDLATGEPFLALATVPTYAAWGALVAWRRSLVPALVSHAIWSTLIAVLAPPV